MTSKISVVRVLRHLLKDQAGLSVVEYAVAGGFVAVVVAASYTTLGTAVTNQIHAVITALG
jgi:pilus assembly protein Flp/PilA